MENQAAYSVRRKEQRSVGQWFSQRQGDIALVSMSICKEAGQYVWHAGQFYLVGKLFLQRQGIFLPYKATLPGQQVILTEAEQQGTKADSFTVLVEFC